MNSYMTTGFPIQVLIHGLSSLPRIEISLLHNGTLFPRIKSMVKIRPEPYCYNGSIAWQSDYSKRAEPSRWADIVALFSIRVLLSQCRIIFLLQSLSGFCEGWNVLFVSRVGCQWVGELQPYGDLFAGDRKDGSISLPGIFPRVCAGVLTKEKGAASLFLLVISL